MVAVRWMLGRKYRTNQVLNPGPVVCKSITLSAHPQLLPSMPKKYYNRLINQSPLSFLTVNKGLDGKQFIVKTHREDERVDGYWEYYKPYELTMFDEHFCFHMPNSIRWVFDWLSRSWQVLLRMTLIVLHRVLNLDIIF